MVDSDYNDFDGGSEESVLPFHRLMLCIAITMSLWSPRKRLKSKKTMRKHWNLTKYERARVLGTWASWSCYMNAPVMAELEGETDPFEIADEVSPAEAGEAVAHAGGTNRTATSQSQLQAGEGRGSSGCGDTVEEIDRVWANWMLGMRLKILRSGTLIMPKTIPRSFVALKDALRESYKFKFNPCVSPRDAGLLSQLTAGGSHGVIEHLKRPMAPDSRLVTLWGLEDNLRRSVEILRPRYSQMWVVVKFDKWQRTDEELNRRLTTAVFQYKDGMPYASVLRIHETWLDGLLRLKNETNAHSVMEPVVRRSMVEVDLQRVEKEPVLHLMEWHVDPNARVYIPPMIDICDKTRNRVTSGSKARIRHTQARAFQIAAEDKLSRKEPGIRAQVGTTGIKLSVATERTLEVQKQLHAQLELQIEAQAKNLKNMFQFQQKVEVNQQCKKEPKEAAPAALRSTETKAAAQTPKCLEPASKKSKISEEQRQNSITIDDGTQRLYTSCFMSMALPLEKESTHHTSGNNCNLFI
ncbi:hypothetical protein SELMODRAFT_419773 [Selaginella moellendorffii]|uniref:Uncharacterized protein n=1 Tax=Selaginella moellendorffii TaxID=88036 RepID=D8S9Z7_SELML|nr:hypothetical protein SELMODRAFT_419773 [Selaginella moellendorffii]